MPAGDPRPGLGAMLPDCALRHAAEVAAAAGLTVPPPCLLCSQSFLPTKQHPRAPWRSTEGSVPRPFWPSSWPPACSCEGPALGPALDGCRRQPGVGAAPGRRPKPASGGAGPEAAAVGSAPPQLPTRMRSQVHRHRHRHQLWQPADARVCSYSVYKTVERNKGRRALPPPPPPLHNHRLTRLPCPPQRLHAGGVAALGHAGGGGAPGRPDTG